MFRALFILLAIAATPAAANDPLRIVALQQCGDLLATQKMTFCLDTTGLSSGPVAVILDGLELPEAEIQREESRLRLALRREWTSGPLWLDQSGRESNAVWLSLQSSHVIAATAAETVKNSDGITTYLDLISVLIEEDQQGLAESQRLAEKYGATVVGAIPPLNVYQLRLPTTTLVKRDALVLRIGSEPHVDAVIIEETSPEPAVESERSESSEKNAAVWLANRFVDATYYYRQNVHPESPETVGKPVRIGIIERNVDFDAADFHGQTGDCQQRTAQTCVYGRDAPYPTDHGSTVTGILAANWDNGGNTGFLRGLDGAGPGFEVIVGRNSDAGITANIAASVNLVEDGVRVLNWSWGLHRVGTTTINGDKVDSLVRSGIAMSGYEELLEEFFRWLRAKHPEVIVVNSAGNGSSLSGHDDYRLPSSFVTDQLLVVGAHEWQGAPSRTVGDPDYVSKRSSSNVDARVDITASACAHASTLKPDEPGKLHCGTSYATPLVTAVISAMLSINPDLQPGQLRMLLRRSALPIGTGTDFEWVDAEDLTAPILPSERNNNLKHQDVGYSARLDMRKALELAIDSRVRVR